MQAINPISIHDSLEVVQTLDLDQVRGGVNDGDGAVESQPNPEGGVDIDWKDPTQEGSPDDVWSEDAEGNGGWGIG